MSMMLSEFDIQMMKDDVTDIIHQWRDKLTILIPLPEKYQRYYDDTMREFNGPIIFCKKVVPAERKDIVNNVTNAIPMDDINYGDKNGATLLYSIPAEIPVYDNDVVIKKEKWKPSRHMIYAIDDSDDRYYSISIKERIGETLIILHRYDGGTPNGCQDIDDIEYINEEIFKEDVPFSINGDADDDIDILENTYDDVNIGTDDEDNTAVVDDISDEILLNGDDIYD